MKPVVKISNGKYQHFSVAGLIFTSDCEKQILLTGKEIYDIKSSFMQLKNVFDNSEKIYNAGFIQNKTKIPFGTKSILNKGQNEIILYIQNSYNEPMFFIYNIKTR